MDRLCPLEESSESEILKAKLPKKVIRPRPGEENPKSDILKAKLSKKIYKSCSVEEIPESEIVKTKLSEKRGRGRQRTVKEIPESEILKAELPKKVDEPCSLGVNPELEILKAKVSKLQADISASNDGQKKDMNFDDVIIILQNEIESFKLQVEVETELKQKLVEENNRLKKYIQEEVQIIECIDKYFDKKSKLNESAVDERKELFFKLELLHRKLVILMKKFVKQYFPQPEVQSSSEFARVFDEDLKSMPKKSLLDILSALIFELSSEDAEGVAKPVLVDDSIWQGHINLLICANIIERCPHDPNYVQLK